MSAYATAPVLDTEKPPRLIFVYTWDIIRAVGAVVAALSAFAGGVDVHGKTVALPLWEQIVGGVSSAAYAAALIVVAILLSHRERWVLRAQLGLLLASALLIVISVPSAAQSASLAPLLISAALFLALDAAAIWSLTRSDAHRWYLTPGNVPQYVAACMTVWFVGSIVLQIVEFHP